MSALTDQLSNQAACIDQCIPDGEKLAVLIYIFNQILTNGPAGSPLHGTGSPLGVVTPSVIGQSYYDTSGNELWMSNGFGAFNWIQPKIS